LKLTAIIEAEGDRYVSLCPELDIARDSIEEARNDFREALDLFFECASPEEVKQRLGRNIGRPQTARSHKPYAPLRFKRTR
jgi:predicted RNase H-like HicB family nuclease